MSVPEVQAGGLGGNGGLGSPRGRLRISFLGRVAYAPAVQLQEELRRRILQGDDSAERLLLLEHHPVVTLGKSSAASDVLAAPAMLEARGIELHRSSRGGAATYHGPGQLVAYPVLRLARGVLQHVEALAAAVIEVAGSFGIAARFRRDRPGVWVGDRKLAAFGVHLHRRVAIHGLALNVAAALDAFELIVPCGQPSTRPVSLAELTGKALEPAALAPALGRAIAGALGRSPMEDPASTLPALLSGIAPVG